MLAGYHPKNPCVNLDFSAANLVIFPFGYLLKHLGGVHIAPGTAVYNHDFLHIVPGFLLYKSTHFSRYAQTYCRSRLAISWKMAIFMP